LAEVLSYEVKRFGIDVSIVEPGFCSTGMSAENTSTAEQNDQSDAYDAFNKFMIEATIQGELAGEDPQCVADMILEAATTDEPKLRWQPGKIGSAIVESWSQSSEEEWHSDMIEGMQLGWWLDGKESG
jgi:NAD(P)-dependent dehydrogenase (short-subunit alcohol dehydrogenase family)